MDGSIKELAKYRFEKACEDFEVAKISASKLREKSDYVDFYIASRQESEEQIEKAKDFLVVIQEYLVENKII